MSYNEEIINSILARLTRLEKSKPTFRAEWVQTESADANLSIIKTGEPSEITGTDRIRFVPKLASVSPVAGDIVECTRNPIIILGVVRGDINLAVDP